MGHRAARRCGWDWATAPRWGRPGDRSGRRVDGRGGRSVGRRVDDQVDPVEQAREPVASPERVRVHRPGRHDRPRQDDRDEDQRDKPPAAARTRNVAAGFDGGGRDGLGHGRGLPGYRFAVGPQSDGQWSRDVPLEAQIMTDLRSGGLQRPVRRRAAGGCRRPAPVPRRPGYPWGMEGMRPARVAIVGVGNVGSSFAYALLLSGIAAEIVMIDANERRAEGEAMDLQHAVPFAKPTRVWAGSYADCAGAAVTVIAAGAGQKPGETRLDLVRRTQRSSDRSCPTWQRPTRRGSSSSRPIRSTC